MSEPTSPIYSNGVLGPQAYRNIDSSTMARARLGPKFDSLRIQIEDLDTDNWKADIYVSPQFPHETKTNHVKPLQACRVKVLKTDKAYFKATTLACVLATTALILILIAGAVTPVGFGFLIAAVALFALATVYHLFKQSCSSEALMTSGKYAAMLLFAPLFALINIITLLTKREEQHIHSVL